MGDRLLRSDELRDLLLADEEDADDPDFDFGSDHASDVNSTDLAADFDDLFLEGDHEGEGNEETSDNLEDEEGVEGE
jgi:hypothetical protein